MKKEIKVAQKINNKYKINVYNNKIIIFLDFKNNLNKK